MAHAHDPNPAAWGGPAGEGFDVVASVFSEAAERGGAAFNVGLHVWEDEATRFVEELTTQGRTTLGQLCECKTPLDVLAVEQDWVRACSQSYVESSLRFADAITSAAREADGGGAEKAPSAAKSAAGPQARKRRA
jgi:hypothetical protein